MITEFKLFEIHAYGKTGEVFFDGDIYITFDDNEGKRRSYNNGKWTPTFAEEKKEVLNMLKEHFNIEEHLEEHAMADNAWAWKIWFNKSFRQTAIQLDIITTYGWTIDEEYNQITAKDFIEVGLENLESFLNAKKYNI